MARRAARRAAGRAAPRVGRQAEFHLGSVETCTGFWSIAFTLVLLQRTMLAFARPPPGHFRCDTRSIALYGFCVQERSGTSWKAKLGRGKLTIKDFAVWRNWASLTPSLRKSGSSTSRVETFVKKLIDGSHIKARKGGPCTGTSPVDRGKCGSKMTVLTDDQSVPICATFCAGNVSDTTQLIRTLEAARTQYGNLARFGELMADKGYDSLQNRIASEAHGLRALIIKRRPRRVNPAVQPADRGRIPAQPIRPNARARPNDAAGPPPPTADENRRIGHHRWAVERCFAWQDNYRRVTLRQEHLMVTFRAMQLLSLTAVVCTRLERMGVLE